MAEREPKIKNGPSTYELDQRVKKLEQQVAELRRARGV
jgi:hypothetical protein